jgi:hypothetical protein
MRKTKKTKKTERLLQTETDGPLVVNGLVRVTSEAVRAVGYAPSGRPARSGTLVVLFVTGGLYEYLDVPPSAYAEFMNAESKGKFVHEELCHYDCRPLEAAVRLVLP